MLVQFVLQVERVEGVEGVQGGALARDMEAMLSQVEPEQWAEVEDDPDLQDEPVLKLDLQVGRLQIELCRFTCMWEEVCLFG